jgi:hypothetical protein
VFGVLTFCYVKRNTLNEQNQVLLKAIIRLLLYLLVGSFLAFIPDVMELIFNPVQRSLKSRTATGLEIVLYYIRHVIHMMLFISSPIMTVALLKPVRKSSHKMCCVKCTDGGPPENAVAAVAAPALNVLVAQPHLIVPKRNLNPARTVRWRDIETHSAPEENDPEPADREKNANGTSRKPSTRIVRQTDHNLYEVQNSNPECRTI